MSKINNISSFSEQDRKVQIAENYLFYGTCRAAAGPSNCSRSTVHKVVRDFIETGDFYATDALKQRISQNKQEAHIRGGMALAQKWKNIKQS